MELRRQELAELEDIQRRLDEGSEARNPYTSLTYPAIQAQFDALQAEGLQGRDVRLQEEMRNQQSNEELRLQFADGANKCVLSIYSIAAADSSSADSVPILSMLTVDFHWLLSQNCSAVGSSRGWRRRVWS